MAPSLLWTEPASLYEVRQVADAGRLYAILDACDAPAVPPKVEALGERGVSLYRGSAEEAYADIAPYLVAVDSDTFDWILETLWGDPWGVLVESDAPLEVLRTHFRKFLTVKSPEGEDWYFRHYDPRVLAKFLPTCTKEELTGLFGPVRAYGVTDDETRGVKWMRPSTAQEAWVQAHPEAAEALGAEGGGAGDAAAPWWKSLFRKPAQP